jgi:hypothetical protein
LQGPSDVETHDIRIDQGGDGFHGVDQIESDAAVCIRFRSGCNAIVPTYLANRCNLRR